jgi:hypothetical protein
MVMKAQRCISILAAASFLWLSLPVQVVAQSSAKPLWSTEQVAGEYTCRWIDPDEGVFDTETSLNWLVESWPRQLILSSDGTWQAFRSNGVFRIQFNEIELMSASWAEGVFAGLVRDKQSTTAIAVYLRGWCANDPDVHLAIICEQKGRTFHDEAMLEKSFPDPRRFSYFSDFPFWR